MLHAQARPLWHFKNNIKLMAASQGSHQAGRVEVMTQPLHSIEEEVSYDKCYVKKKKELKNYVVKLQSKDSNHEY